MFASTFASTFASQIEANVEANIWVPPPENAVAAGAVTAAVVGVASLTTAAVIAPVGAPTGKMTKRIRDILPKSVKKWLSTFIMSKRKLTVDEKQGSPFIPTRAESVAYAISITVLTFSFSYVKVSSLAEIFSVLPTILATSILVDLVKTFVLVAYARQHGVWAERKLWYFGLVTFLVTTFAFRVPFSSPSRSVFHGSKFSKQLGTILCVASIGISLVFAGLFYVLLVSGFAVIGSTGLAMCIIGAFFDTFPIAPMRGKTIFNHNKILWIVLFILTLVLYGAWLFLL